MEKNIFFEKLYLTFFVTWKTERLLQFPQKSF